MKKSFDQMYTQILGEMGTPQNQNQNPAQQPTPGQTPQYQNTPTPNANPNAASQANIDELLKQIAELAKDAETKKKLMAALTPGAPAGTNATV
jgi:hypothetical protein